MKEKINGILVNYEQCGDNSLPALVLVHGFPFGLEMWRPQLEMLSSRFRVIAYDVRGFGGSECGDGQYTLEFFVDDLVGLLDHLNIEKAAVCGLSMGGYIALRAYERNPEYFSALILADTRAEADSNEAKLKRAAAIRAVKADGPARYAEGFIKSVFAGETLSKRADLVESAKQLIASNSAQGIAGALLAMASRNDLTHVLGLIGVPVLILVGESDSLTPPELARALQEKIPNATLEVVPQAGHLSSLENPAAFNSSVAAFLSRL